LLIGCSSVFQMFFSIIVSAFDTIFLKNLIPPCLFAYYTAPALSTTKTLNISVQ